MEAEIRKLSSKGGNGSDDEPARKKVKKSHLEEELAKYSKGRGLHKKAKDGRRKDEDDVLAALSSFRSKLKSTLPDDGDDDVAAPASTSAPGEGDGGESAAPKIQGEEDPGMEVDDDTGFLSHALHFPKGNDEEVAKAERDYEVIDPRQRGARAREEERERKRTMKPKDGGRGYRR